MVAQITANDLKVKGISAIDAIIDVNDGVIITVRGVEKYVVLPIEEYNKLREFELDAAIQESLKDIEAGKFFSGSIDEHLKRVINV
jgi:PHD/YefM family antitoxin component YafN of YafNO toxin-antitoxin module